MCALSLPKAWSNHGNWRLVMGEIKERNHSKNPNSTFDAANTDIRAMNGRKGVKKIYHKDVLEHQPHSSTLLLCVFCQDVKLSPNRLREHQNVSGLKKILLPCHVML